MFRSFGEEVDGATGFVHVTVKFVGYFEPFGLFDVGRDAVKTNLGLSDNSLLAGGVFGVVFLVKGVFSLVIIDRVRRIDLGSLVRTVSGTLRVRGTISDKSEDRESGGFSSSGVGNSRDQSGTSSGNSSKGLTTRVLLNKKEKKLENKLVALILMNG